MVKYLIVLHTLYFQMHKGIGIIHLKQTQNEHALQKFRVQSSDSSDFVFRTVPVPYACIVFFHPQTFCSNQGGR